ncbi:zinc ribbon domain-containing protein [Clostridium beijerinckii]|uniref:DUF5050 domain-containing protein n=1 Tax=Clostridium beijerinckii TaxID=1520 RepID=A0A1S8S1F8_CLOBE|nr:zinc ribbon domain-containing protein [Clostridium beijerinckii]NRY60671.1 hypothetical protein [Clostridium beijerinckii]OOM59290.1 hypothetical protein CLBCK_35890 [Clostridium beijerinckii]
MFCGKCGEQLEDEAIFCDNCGTKITNDKEEWKGDKKRGNKLKKVSIITVSIFILVIGLAFWKINSNNGTVNKEVSKTLSDNASNSNNKKNVLGSGNTNSNTVNGSLATEYNDEIYFRQYDKSTSKNTLYKMNKDGTDVKVVLDDIGNCVNIVDGWAYYTKVNNQGNGWSIGKIKLDGSEEKQLLNDGNKCYYSNLSVVNGENYYINTLLNAKGCAIGKIGDETLVVGNLISINTEEEYSNLNVTEDGIYYIKYIAEYDEKNNWNKVINRNFEICKADLDGKNERVLLKEECILDEISELVVDGKNIYYGLRPSDSKEYSIYRLENDDEKTKSLIAKGYSFNIANDGYIYYIRNDNKLEKIKADNPSEYKVIDEDFSANSINVVDNWIFYFDGRHLTNGKMKTDGTKIND